MRRANTKRGLQRVALVGWMLLAQALWVVNHRAAEWPAFRGQDGDGRSPETGVFPSAGPVDLEVSWRRALGSGYSGIAVAGGRLFTLFSDGDDDRLIALDTASGATLWQLPLGPTYLGHDGSHTGPLATPAVGSELVFALGPRGDLVAARVESGEVLWRIHLPQAHQARKPHYGFSASPRLLGEILVLPVGGGGRAIGGFNARTGALEWSAGTDAFAYQSPIIWPPGDHERVVFAGNTRLFVLDARRGSVLWQFPHEGFGTRGADSLSPVAVGPDRLLLTHRDDASSLIEIDRVAIDRAAIDRVAGSGPQTTLGSATRIWESRSIRNSYALPVVYAGNVYAYSSRFLTCVDAETGESRWRSRDPGDGFPILVDGHLVIQTKQGGLHLVRATAEGYQERAARALFSAHSWTSPSFAQGAIYSRSLSEIARVDPVGKATELQTADSQISRNKSPGHPASDGQDGPEAPTNHLLRNLQNQLREAADPKLVLDAALLRWRNLGAGRAPFPLIEGDTAHFIYRGEARDVALAGDLPGARREWPMTRMAETDLFFHSVRLEPDAAISYLFLVDFEPTLDPLNPRQVRSSVYGPDFEPIYGGDLAMSWLVMPGWQEPGWQAPDELQPPDETRQPPRPRGTLEQTALPSSILGREVPLTVYRPPGYTAARRYPVVYLFGGRGALDRGGFPQALDHLIGDAVQPLVAVFILQDGFGSLSVFADMFANELVPFIDSTYSTLAVAESRISVGMGWEALTAAYSTLRRPGTVGKMALQSIYALTAPEGGPANWLRPSHEQRLEVYLDWGKYDLRNSHEAWSMADDSRRFFERLQALGYDPVG
ncbi:MAG: PQQ-binding-like beta-propeller repeat protein, partial [Acidobacteriota bacterium]